jgi:hypothetical protein
MGYFGITKIVVWLRYAHDDLEVLANTQLRPGDVVLDVEMQVRNVDAPHDVGPITLRRVLTGLKFDGSPEDRDATIRRYVRSVVREAVLHEVDEWLRFDGVRLTDPHPSHYGRPR